MAKTIVLQSHTQPLPADWLEICINSVEEWTALNGFDYEFYDDKLFEFIEPDLADKLSNQIVIATDLARLKVLQYSLTKGYDTVIWCDADFLIFAPQKFKLLDETYALGREIWIQNSNKTETQNRLSCNIKVHNAFMMFRESNTFLDFYTEAAERLLKKNVGAMSPQFIGPKLLTAIHNIVQCPVTENAGMLSPLVIKDISVGVGPALDLYIQKSKQPTYAANLCSSLYFKQAVTQKEIETCISTLLNTQGLLN